MPKRFLLRQRVKPALPQPPAPPYTSTGTPSRWDDLTQERRVSLKADSTDDTLEIIQAALN